MDEARRLSASQPWGAVTADEQSAGRGRLAGRSWETSSAQALLTTIWFPRSALAPTDHPDQGAARTAPFGAQSAQGERPASLLAGVAAAKACLAWAESASCTFGNGLAIKWPNDLLCGTRKLAGILCEARQESILVGIGINCLQTSFTSVYRRTPTSILLETGQAPDRVQLLGLILKELWLLISGSLNWEKELDSLLAWKGKAVVFRPGLADGPAVRGRLSGIAHDGSLGLDTGGSVEYFHSGELGPVIDEDPEA